MSKNHNVDDFIKSFSPFFLIVKILGKCGRASFFALLLYCIGKVLFCLIAFNSYLQLLKVSNYSIHICSFLNLSLLTQLRYLPVGKNPSDYIFTECRFGYRVPNHKVEYSQIHQQSERLLHRFPRLERKRKMYTSLAYSLQEEFVITR